MDEPLCPSLGNAVEVAVCLEVMEGNRMAAPRLHDLTVALGGRLLALAGEAEGEGEERVAEAIASGAAMERFCRMAALMGGPADLEGAWRERLPRAPVQLAGSLASLRRYSRAQFTPDSYAPRLTPPLTVSVRGWTGSASSSASVSGAASGAGACWARAAAAVRRATRARARGRRGTAGAGSKGRGRVR